MTTEKRITTVTQKGQVTIPREVREYLGVGPRDKVTFRIDRGEVKIERLEGTLESAFGAVRPLGKSADFRKQIREAKEERAEKAARKLSRA